MKRVVTYANCQAKNVCRILATHPELSREYDFENPTIVSNFGLIQGNTPVPTSAFQDADLVLYQPTADSHGQYATSSVLAHCKPECVRISFPYIYNYSFWEVMAFADGDYAVGHDAAKYARLNHAPITRLREQGVPFTTIESLIKSKQFNWDFASRYAESQRILREKESECDVKVADFIDAHHKDTLLFFTQNHPGLPVLRHVAEQIITRLGYDPTRLPNDVPAPDYAPDSSSGPHIPIGWFAWKHFGFSFIPEPAPNTFPFIIHHAKKIYDQVYVNT